MMNVNVKYINFLLEKLDSVKFEEEYKSLKEEIKDFWTLLEDKLDEFSHLNSRDVDAVAEFNRKKREARNGTPPPAVSNTGTTTVASNTGTTIPTQPAKKVGIYDYLIKMDTPDLVRLKKKTILNPKGDKKLLAAIDDRINIRAQKANKATNVINKQNVPLRKAPNNVYKINKFNQKNPNN